jgi:hypothetical protein
MTEQVTSTAEKSAATQAAWENCIISLELVR